MVFKGLVYLSLYLWRCCECEYFFIGFNSSEPNSIVTSCSRFSHPVDWKGHTIYRNIPVRRTHLNTSRLFTEKSSIRGLLVPVCLSISQNSHRREPAELNEHPALIDHPFVHAGIYIITIVLGLNLPPLKDTSLIPH